MPRACLCQKLPFVLDLVESNRLDSAEHLDSAREVDHFAIELAFSDANSATEHLIVERHASRRANQNDAVERWMIETCRQDANIEDCLNSTFLEVVDDRISSSSRRLRRDAVSSFDDRCELLSLLD